VIPHRQNFSLGHWQLAQLTSLIQKALYGRISLLPTGTPAVQIPLSVGQANKQEAGVADGQILISGRVAAAAEKVILLEDLGSLTLKGLSQPVSAFNVPLAATQPALRVIEGGPPSV
jgi:hypothetical protein